MPITAVVDPVTNEFCLDGNAPGRIVVTVPKNPNPATEKYSGDLLNPIAAKTAAEKAASTLAQTNAAADMQWGADDSPLLDALLGHLPAIVAEIQATGKIQSGLWRTRVRATMRSLRRAKESS